MEPSRRLNGDVAAAASPQGLADRRELALIAVERTHMPMVVTDVRQEDCPIVLANRAFLTLSGYSAEEVIGRNCRFLQGPKTSSEAVAEIRAAIAEERDATVELLNYRKDGSTFWNELHISPVHDEEGTLIYVFGSQLDVTAVHHKRQLEASEHRLLREVDHRAKNVLALVQGIVRLSRAEDAASFAASVQGRVDALARAHGILAELNWTDIPLDQLIYAEVAPYGTRRITLDGPPVALPAPLVQPMGLLLHELVANAAAHGSLSVPEGYVAIQWRQDQPGSPVMLHWEERGGPPPKSHRPQGFGSSMIKAIVERQLGGNLVLHWSHEGLDAELAIPLSKVA